MTRGGKTGDKSVLADESDMSMSGRSDTSDHVSTVPYPSVEGRVCGGNYWWHVQIETHWKLTETYWTMNLTESPWNSLKLTETHLSSLTLLKLPETSWNSLKLTETPWNSLKLTETPWNSHHWNDFSRKMVFLKTATPVASKITITWSRNWRHVRLCEDRQSWSSWPKGESHHNRPTTCIVYRSCQLSTTR